MSAVGDGPSVGERLVVAGCLDGDPGAEGGRSDKLRRPGFGEKPKRGRTQTNRKGRKGGTLGSVDLKRSRLEFQ